MFRVISFLGLLRVSITNENLWDFSGNSDRAPTWPSAGDMHGQLKAPSFGGAFVFLRDKIDW